MVTPVSHRAQTQWLLRIACGGIHIDHGIEYAAGSNPSIDRLAVGPLGPG